MLFLSASLGKVIKTFSSVRLYVHEKSGESPEYVTFNIGGTFENYVGQYRGADKSLARPGRQKATATESFDVHISYL